MNTVKKQALRLKRKKRIRSRISGTAERPRLSIYRSARHMSAQLIDDVKGVTLLTVSSFGKGEKDQRASVKVCVELGKKVAEQCKAKNITRIVFDKNGFNYHGRVKAIADGAREGGLQF
jgi:large subunit ribosomal protein L18